MIVSFADIGTEHIFDGRNSKTARKCCPVGIWSIARRKLDQINSALNLKDLSFPPGNRLEGLKGDKPTAWLRYAKDSTALGLIINIEFALFGLMQEQPRYRS